MIIQRIRLLQRIAVAVLVVLPFWLIGRDAPVTTAGSSSVCTATAITVPVTVTGFISVTAISLRIDYDPTRLVFVTYANLNPSLLSSIINVDSVSPTLKKVLMVWTSVVPLSLGDNSKMFDLNFTLIGGTSSVTFNNESGGGGECEYADELGNAMNDIPSSSFYHNATVANLMIGSMGNLTGKSSVCRGETNVTYSVPPVVNAATYTWTVPPGATIIAGSNTNSIVVNYSLTASPGTVSVQAASSCGPGTPATMTVTVNPLPSPTLTGPANLCENAPGNTYTTESGMSSYQWSVSPGASITSGGGHSDNYVTITWVDPGGQSVGVNYLTLQGCAALNSATVNVQVNPIPGDAGMISGPAGVCRGTMGITYSVAPIPNTIVYLWTLPQGVVLNSGGGTNTIVVSFGSLAQSGNISVVGNNTCGNGTPSPVFYVSVDLPAGPAGEVSGPDSVCAWSEGAVYRIDPVQNATGYFWELPSGASILSGANTNEITVAFGPVTSPAVISASGNNGCGQGDPSPGFNVFMSSTPEVPVITSSGFVLTSSAPDGNQWFYEGTPIPGATGQTYTVVHNTGYYWCTVTLGACESRISNKIWVEVVGMAENDEPQFSVFPVPNRGTFTVKILTKNDDPSDLTFFNSMGITILEIKNINACQGVEKEISLQSGIHGVVMAVLRHSGRISQRKIVITP